MRSRIFPYLFRKPKLTDQEKSCFVVQRHPRILFNRCTVLLGFNRLYNTRIYNFIFVPQVTLNLITRFLSGDAIISRKADPHNGSKIERRNFGKIKEFFILNNKAVFSDAFLVYNWKKVWFRNTFFSFIFCSEMIVLTAEKDQIRYSAQN